MMCVTHTQTRIYVGFAAGIYLMPHERMSHVTYMNESCYTYEWVMSHIQWVISHTWMSHVTHMDELWMSHVTHMNESCHAYEWVMSHIWMSHVTHVNESCHTCTIGNYHGGFAAGMRWVPHIWISHVTHMNESCHTYE